MRLARVLGGLGRLLIWAGSIILLFVVYQLWGTNIAEARAQNDLQSQFDELLATTTTTSSTTTTSAVARSTTTTTTTTLAPTPPPDTGDAVAHVVIPRIGVDKIVVEGVGRSDLRKGPGHYPETPMPGQSGNAAIAGHRTTYGAPFNRIDELEPGDPILITTSQGSFTYEVIGTEIVAPTQVEVVEDKGDDRLTLTSCNPKYSARQRIVVSAALVETPAPTPPTVPPTTVVDSPTPQPEPEAPTVESAGVEPRGPLGPVIWWGAVTLAVWLFFYVLSRRWRRWPAYLIGLPFFGIALFVFFGAVANTLPANF